MLQRGSGSTADTIRHGRKKPFVQTRNRCGRSRGSDHQKRNFSAAVDGSIDQKTAEVTSKALSRVLCHSAEKDGAALQRASE